MYIEQNIYNSKRNFFLIEIIIRKNTIDTKSS
jgi:hypothetical protein